MSKCQHPNNFYDFGSCAICRIEEEEVEVRGLQKEVKRLQHILNSAARFLEQRLLYEAHQLIRQNAKRTVMTNEGLKTTGPFIPPGESSDPSQTEKKSNG